MLIIITSLLGVPIVTAMALLAVKSRPVRDVIIRVSSALLIVGSVVLFVAAYGRRPVALSFDGSELVGNLLTLLELGIAGFLVYITLKWKSYLGFGLVVLQLGLMVVSELVGRGAPPPASVFMIDQLSVLMTMVAGIVGGLIALYSAGYMRSYHYFHPEVRDRRRFFFFLEFIFLAAMFGLVFSNDLKWLYFFWEVTTLCSFLLIGYTDTAEARKNSLLALVINLGGGVAFMLAMIYLQATGGAQDLTSLLASSKAAVLIPVALFSIAGFTKSAQLPFSGWLLGAMVAPTPVSALLHSSTMVKAGVYLILRMAPLLNGTVLGYAVSLVGGFTFFVTSLLAVSQTNAKRMLAYSTVANLGLIVACAGIGNYQTVWVALFIILFHAVAKSLLFLGVGVVGYKLHSNDIEEMDNLIVRFPGLALMIVIGICGMFIAPFGMLISKWAALEAFIDLKTWIGPVIIFFLAYGSAATIFFWGKWMGKLISINRSRWKDRPEDKRISRDEWISMGSLAVLTVTTVIGFALISRHLVEPFVDSLFGYSRVMERSDLILSTVMMGMMIVIPFFLLFVPRKSRTKLGRAYMAGRDTTDDLVFRSSSASSTALSLRNFYLEGLFGERRLLRAGIIVGSAMVLFVVGAIFL